MIKEYWKTGLFLILVILILSFGWACGYVTHIVSVQKQDGISFNCYNFNAKYRQSDYCEANITIANVTIYMHSNFDELKILRG